MKSYILLFPQCFLLWSSCIKTGMNYSKTLHIMVTLLRDSNGVDNSQIKSNQYSFNWQNTTTDTDAKVVYIIPKLYLMGEEQNKRQDKMNTNNRPNTNN